MSSLGRVLIEGMACEVPVIGSDSGEIPVVVGDAGLIFPEGDSEALADRIEQIAQKSGVSQSAYPTWTAESERIYLGINSRPHLRRVPNSIESLNSARRFGLWCLEPGYLNNRCKAIF